MAYIDQINSLKEALNSYSAEEEKLSALYKTAIENAEKAHQTAKAQLDAQYDIDRNTAYADSARSERNFNNLLAERGLGFSGEAAQGKLNSNMALSNRLGSLEREKNQGSLKLDADLASNKSTLSMDEAEKLKSILDSKTKLGAEIAGMELERETEANRLAWEKESQANQLKHDKETEANRLAWEKESQANQLKHDKEIEANKLAWEKEALAQNIIAEREALAEKLKAEQQSKNAQIKADKDMQALELQFKYSQLEADKNAKDLELKAEKELQDAKLKAEWDMLQAELEAKYNDAENDSSSGSKNNNSTNKNTSTGKNYKDMPVDDPSDDGGTYLPNITAPNLAKQLINTATSGNGYVSDDEHDYIINKYLIQLREGYNIDEDFYNELIFMLKAYGYEERTYPDMRVHVITYDTKAYYKQTYDEYLEALLMKGVDEFEAQKKAKEVAASGQIEYMYKKSNSNLEFIECCQKMGIGLSKAREYIQAMEAKLDATSPSSGNVSSQTVRTGK